MTQDAAKPDASPRGAELAHLVVECAEQHQASEIVLLDVRGLCGFADYFVIASAQSQPQLDALVDGTIRPLRARGVRPLGVEGGRTGWRLVDLNDVVVHFFDPEQRALYDLEGLWDQARAMVRIQ